MHNFLKMTDFKVRGDSDSFTYFLPCSYAIISAEKGSISTLVFRDFLEVLEFSVITIQTRESSISE
jgi:hypothetical protein